MKTGASLASVLKILILPAIITYVMLNKPLFVCFTLVCTNGINRHWLGNINTEELKYTTFKKLRGFLHFTKLRCIDIQD